MKQKKIPLRRCTGCSQMKPKRELVRIVKAPEVKDADENVISGGEISLDLTGKMPGRGAYVCKNTECLKKARKAKRLERSLSCKIPEEVYDELGAQLEKCGGEEV